METFISIVVLAAFGYFIYSKVRESQKRKAERQAEWEKNPPAPRPPRDDRDPIDDRFDRR